MFTCYLFVFITTYIYVALFDIMTKQYKYALDMIIQIHNEIYIEAKYEDHKTSVANINAICNDSMESLERTMKKYIENIDEVSTYYGWFIFFVFMIYIVLVLCIMLKTDSEIYN